MGLSLDGAETDPNLRGIPRTRHSDELAFLW